MLYDIWFKPRVSYGDLHPAFREAYAHAAPARRIPAMEEDAELDQATHRMEQRRVTRNQLEGDLLGDTHIGSTEASTTNVRQQVQDYESQHLHHARRVTSIEINPLVASEPVTSRAFLPSGEASVAAEGETQDEAMPPADHDAFHECEDSNAGDEDQDQEFKDAEEEPEDIQRGLEVPFSAMAMGDTGAWIIQHRRGRENPVFPTGIPVVNRLLAQVNHGETTATIKEEIGQAITGLINAMDNYLSSSPEALSLYNSGTFASNGACHDKSGEFIFNAFESPLLHLMAGTTLESSKKDVHHSFNNLRRKFHPDKIGNTNADEFNTLMEPYTWAKRTEGIFIGSTRTKEIVRDCVPGAVVSEDPLVFTHVKDWEDDIEVTVAEWLNNIPEGVQETVQQEAEELYNYMDEMLQEAVAAWRKQPDGIWYNSILQATVPDKSQNMRELAIQYAQEKKAERQVKLLGKKSKEQIAIEDIAKQAQTSRVTARNSDAHATARGANSDGTLHKLHRDHGRIQERWEDEPDDNLRRRWMNQKFDERLAFLGIHYTHASRTRALHISPYGPVILANNDKGWVCLHSGCKGSQRVPWEREQCTRCGVQRDSQLLKGNVRRYQDRSTSTSRPVSRQ